MVRTIFIDRGNSVKARETMDQAVRDMRQNKLSLFVFPEGTRSRTRERTMLPFKKGAFHLAVQSGFPVVPVVFSAYDDIFDSRNGSFLGGTVHIRVLPNLPTTHIDSEDKAAIDELMEQTRSKMVHVLKEISPRIPEAGIQNTRLEPTQNASPVDEKIENGKSSVDRPTAPEDPSSNVPAKDSNVTASNVSECSMDDYTEVTEEDLHSSSAESAASTDLETELTAESISELKKTN
jgi:lysophosphatidate acyltransferase